MMSEGEKHIIPAEPGWFLVVRDGRDTTYEQPIIAWYITIIERHRDVIKRGGDQFFIHHPDPITLMGNTYDGGGRWAFKDPTGRYSVPCDEEGCRRFFANKEECDAYLINDGSEPEGDF
jgi:hypothetical protein